jgi:hypothetical protein
MLTMAIWWLGILLESLILVRGLEIRLVRQFPVFYSYILFVFLEELLRFSVYRWYPLHYFQVYWITQFLSLVIGSAVILEIYRVGLRGFPGTARMTRYLLLIVFGAIFARTLINPSGSLFVWLAQSSVELERNLRIVQALAILTLVTAFLWYAVPFGRNLRGILLGYGLFLALGIIQLTLMSDNWGAARVYWSYAQSTSYLIVLIMWTGALWSPHLAPETGPAMQLEDDYLALVASTRGQLQRTLARLGWMARA